MSPRKNGCRDSKPRATNGYYGNRNAVGIRLTTRHPLLLIQEQVVRQIRLERKELDTSYEELALYYGINKNMICKIIHGLVFFNAGGPICGTDFFCSNCRFWQDQLLDKL